MEGVTIIGTTRDTISAMTSSAMTSVTTMAGRVITAAEPHSG